MGKKSTHINILSARDLCEKEVYYDTILGLEEEFIDCNNDNSIIKLNRLPYKMNKILGLIHIGGRIPDYKVIREVHKNCDEKCFFAAMGVKDISMHKATLKCIHEQLIIYVFDCWENSYGAYERLFSQINPYAIFFAYKKAQEYFAQKRENCFFMAQSMNVKYFHDYAQEKTRLFVQIGRRVELLHKMVESYLVENQIENTDVNYVYEKVKGEVIFPNPIELANEINRSFFFLAAPKCVENREMTGNISEVTARYYEAMACKSLIVGIKPKDSFDILFPYENAMIEVTSENFHDKINELLAHPEKYREIVEYNYRYVMENHRWRNRYQDLIDIVNYLE